jgi:exonuclease-1
MGISGLLPSLKKLQRDVNIKEYAGKRVAVDGHCWLHRGAISCADDLALGFPTVG